METETSVDLNHNAPALTITALTILFYSILHLSSHLDIEVSQRRLELYLQLCGLLLRPVGIRSEVAPSDAWDPTGIGMGW
jgi:hypothetical protein